MYTYGSTGNSTPSLIATNSTSTSTSTSSNSSNSSDEEDDVSIALDLEKDSSSECFFRNPFQNNPKNHEKDANHDTIAITKNSAVQYWNPFHLDYSYRSKSRNHRHHYQNVEKNRGPAKNKIWTSWHKLGISFSLWLICYYTMAVFGGAVAFMHFPRTSPDVDTPITLPDYGYDLIPEYCPRLGILYKDNIQSEVLLIFYVYFIFYCLVFRMRNWGDGVQNHHGIHVFQQLLHLHCMVFLTRTTTVGLTGLPQPNPKCVSVQHSAVTYMEALQFVVLRGFPPRACGDLLYSGHVACILICVIIMCYHKVYPHYIVRNFFLMLALVGIYGVISCRSHYSIDVILACYFSFGLSFVYYTVRDYPKWNWIKWLDSAEEHEDGFVFNCT